MKILTSAAGCLSSRMSIQPFQMGYERLALASLLKGDREALPHSIEGPILAHHQYI